MDRSHELCSIHTYFVLDISLHTYYYFIPITMCCMSLFFCIIIDCIIIYLTNDIRYGTEFSNTHNFLHFIHANTSEMHLTFHVWTDERVHMGRSSTISILDLDPSVCIRNEKCLYNVLSFTNLLWKYS